MNLVINKMAGMPFVFKLLPFFERLPGLCQGHDWLLTAVDCNYYPDPRIPYRPDVDLYTPEGGIVLRGEELWDVACRYADLQFINAVFSALTPGTRPSHKFRDGWLHRAEPRLPEAEFEIVAFDSSTIHIFGASDDLAAQIRAAIPEARPDAELPW